jgi:exonuclease SbcD
LSNKHLAKNAAQITDYLSNAVATIIASYARELDPSVPAVLAGHLTVSSGVFSGSEKRAIYGNDPILLPSQLAIPPFDYIALGHLHRHQRLGTSSAPIVYSGSIERVDFGERNEPKGFCLVTIHDKKQTEYTFIETAARPFIQIDLELDGPNQTQQLLKVLSERELKGAVIKILYRLPEGKKDLVDTAAIQNACAAAIYCVGITPVRSSAIRERRGFLSTSVGDRDLSSMLGAYLTSKPELRERSAGLIEKARELLATADQKEES